MTYRPIYSLSNHASHPGLLRIEMASSFQLPGIHIVGLPSREVEEAKERVRSAIESAGLEFPKRRIVLNLSPAHLKKVGTGLDLPMALSILGGDPEFSVSASTSTPTTVSPPAKPAPWFAWGELSLAGEVRSVGYPLRALYVAWQEGVDRAIFPAADRPAIEAARKFLNAAKIFAHPAPALVFVQNLADAYATLPGEPEAAETTYMSAEENPPAAPRPFAPGLLAMPVYLRRVLGVAAAGSHHLLILGPKGAGKSQALERLLQIAPEPLAETQLEQAFLSELVALSPTPGEPVHRRVGPHVKPPALIGSYQRGALHPGAFALCHGGYLIADELAEWNRDSLECLREPLESGFVTLSRTPESSRLPARFVLAAAANLCPCGGWPDDPRGAASTPLAKDPSLKNLRHPGVQPLRCHCSVPTRRRYLEKISGPILDRIDVTLRWQPELAAISTPTRSSTPSAPSAPLSTEIEDREKVQKTRDFLVMQWGAPSGSLDAFRLEGLLSQYPDWARQPGLENASSLRARHKILRVALTLAAWDGQAEPRREHFREATLLRWNGMEAETLLEPWTAHSSI